MSKYSSVRRIDATIDTTQAVRHFDRALLTHLVTLLIGLAIGAAVGVM
jgi:hypothetical protein